MSDRTHKRQLPQAPTTADWRAPQWGADVPAREVFPGYGGPIDPGQLEAELTRFVGAMTARGWTEVHRMPGAVLLAQVQSPNRATAAGVGVTGVAAGAAVGGAGFLGVLGGICVIILGLVLTLTIIGAIIGIPMVAAGAAMITGGTAAVTAGGAVGATGAAVGISGVVSRDHTQRVQAWVDETGRIFTKDMPPAP
ncbi:hypothetical protein [Streptomyces sp. NPDC047046]|uniref:hypothetical protein n=1 Tax=Streptomyces sp. NPDC047046 TaxID=3155378 RepID=UPI0033CBF06C